MAEREKEVLGSVKGEKIGGLVGDVWMRYGVFRPRMDGVGIVACRHSTVPIRSLQSVLRMLS